MEIKQIPINDAENCIAAKAVIPYPPGIPIVLKGEKIGKQQIDAINHLIASGVRMQQRNQNMVSVFIDGEAVKGEEVT